MAVMMNTLGRRAQAQSDSQAQAAQAEGGEPPAKEKVTHHIYSNTPRTGQCYACVMHFFLIF